MENLAKTLANFPQLLFPLNFINFKENSIFPRFVTCSGGEDFIMDIFIGFAYGSSTIIARNGFSVL